MKLDNMKFMKLNEAGLDASFRCSCSKDCDSCKKGSGYERISIRQEAEQELIKKVFTLMQRGVEP